MEAQDSHFMQRCLQLARLGSGQVSPNPMVGCLIVHDGCIIGEGYHRRFGGPHAEAEAIASVKDKSLLRHSAVYVSLEPCAHHGKTPPCADLLIHHGIRKVFVACADPFPEVAGRGVSRLRDSGASVHVGLLEQEARELNRRFLTSVEQQRPYIILKWAETRDGFVDSIRTSAISAPLKVTCEAADVLSHTWRAEEDAVMIGTRTALMDNPSLTVRHAAGPSPIRIIIDSHLSIPAEQKVLDQTVKTIIVNELKEAEGKVTRLLRVHSTKDIGEVLGALGRLGIRSIMVEGGPTLHASFLQSGMWDEVRRYISPTAIGAGIRAVAFDRHPDTISAIGSDLLHTYRNSRP